MGALKVVDSPQQPPHQLFRLLAARVRSLVPGRKGAHTAVDVLARMNRELKRADLIIVQSKFCKESMVYNGMPAEKVMVNPVGVDTSIFKKRENVPDKIRFISVGTICLRKGHQYLFRAFEIVKRKLARGGVDLRWWLQRGFSERKDQNGRVVLPTIPTFPHRELAALLHNMHGFVFPRRKKDRPRPNRSSGLGSARDRHP